MTRRAHLLYIHASEDERLRQALEKHLTSLVLEGLIESWHAGLLSVGVEVEQQLATEVALTEVVLLLLSADFMASASCQTLLAQVQRAQAEREIQVVPILVRPVDSYGCGTSGLRPLPLNGVPVTLWPNPDAAWLDVAQALRALLTRGTAQMTGSAQRQGIETALAKDGTSSRGVVVGGSSNGRIPGDDNGIDKTAQPMIGGSARPVREIIVFTVERSRHKVVLGREDALAQLDRWMLQEGDPRYVLVTAGPGCGKSALLSEWLRRRELKGDLVPHHFLQRSQQNWDQPALIVRNLAAQIEQLFPEQRDVDAEPKQRLSELLGRVSTQILQPERRRLMLLIDALDEAAGGENPLPQFIPHALPPGVLLLCASRPTYPGLPWLDGRDNVVHMDLDGAQWASSNEAACRAFWDTQSFEPPLPAGLVDEALHLGNGNLLYAVKLAERLRQVMPGERRVHILPRGLDGYLNQVWQDLIQLRSARDKVLRGLGLLCAAKEALPLSVLDRLLEGLDAREAFLRAARPVLLEELAEWHRKPADAQSMEVAYRLYHDSFRSFLIARLGAERLREYQKYLAKELACWPTNDTFRRRYALRHAIHQNADANLWDQVYALCLDTEYLRTRLHEVGQQALEEDIEQAAHRCPDLQKKSGLSDVARALRAESHWLRSRPAELPWLLRNRLIDLGWSSARIEEELKMTEGSASLRLRHPLARRDQSTRTLLSQPGRVWACAISSDGRFCLSGSTTGILRVWDVDSGKELVAWSAHAKSVTACALSADGKKGLSGSIDGTLRVWDLERSRELHTLSGHLVVGGISSLGDSDGVTSCSIDATGMRGLSAGQDGMLRVWDLQYGCEQANLTGHEGGIRTCAISADGKRGLSGGDDGTLRFWDVESGKELVIIHAHEDGVSACAMSADGMQGLSGGQDRTLKLWDLNEGSGRVLACELRYVQTCSMSADGRWAISAEGDMTLRFWDLQGAQGRATPSGHSGYVKGCSISADGRRAVTASTDGTVKVWELDRSSASTYISGHSDRINDCALSNDGLTALSASSDGTLKVWDVRTGRELRTLAGHWGPMLHGSPDRVRWDVTSCSVSADGRRGLSGGNDKAVKLWDLVSGQELAALSTDSVTCCTLSPDGCLGLSGTERGPLTVWDMKDGRAAATLLGHAGWVTACVFFLGGKRAASASIDGTLRIWDLEQSRELSVLTPNAGKLYACSVNEGGTKALCGAEDGTLRLWDLDHGIELQTISGHSARISKCAMSSNGKWAVSASVDNSLVLWDLESGTSRATLFGRAPFNCVAVQGDSVAAGDTTGNVWFLELRVQSKLRDLPAKPQPVFSVSSVQPPRPKGVGVGFLHLTDLHQGMPGQSWRWPDVRAEFFNDLARLHDRCGPWGSGVVYRRPYPARLGRRICSLRRDTRPAFRPPRKTRLAARAARSPRQPRSSAACRSPSCPPRPAPVA